jgi:ABC-type transport system involved in cytochrome c biogenesis permease component
MKANCLGFGALCLLFAKIFDGNWMFAKSHKEASRRGKCLASVFLLPVVIPLVPIVIENRNEVNHLAVKSSKEQVNQEYSIAISYFMKKPITES